MSSKDWFDSLSQALGAHMPHTSQDLTSGEHMVWSLDFPRPQQDQGGREY